MRILTEPKVYLIARPQIVEEGLRAFLADCDLRWPTPTEGVKDAERLVEAAGRCCYMSFGVKAGSKTNAAYIDNLLGRLPDGTFRPGVAHGSVCEHPCWSFVIVGAGRGMSHELVRHRVGVAISQLSTRYCDFERDEEEGTWDPGFTVPPLAQLSEDTLAAFGQRLRESRQAYTDILYRVESDLMASPEFRKGLEAYPERERHRVLRKAARGAARDILPNATEAIMVWSANARTIWNVIVMRASDQAEAEIRKVFVQVARIMEAEMPALFGGLRYIDLWDGSTAAVMPRDKL